MGVEAARADSCERFADLFAQANAAEGPVPDRTDDLTDAGREPAVIAARPQLPGGID